jgi:hypothetical protein
MLQRDLGGVLDLLGRAAQRGAEPGGRHGRGRPDLPLAAALRRPEIEALCLISPPMAEAVSRNTRRPSSVAPAVVAVVAHHRGHHARRAVGGRGDHTPPRGVLLVHRHGIDAEPVVDGVRLRQVDPALRQQLLVDAPRPPLHPQPAGQFALHPQAAFDAIVHRLPDRVEPRHLRDAGRTAVSLAPISSRRWSCPSPAHRSISCAEPKGWG